MAGTRVDDDPLRRILEAADVGIWEVDLATDEIELSGGLAAMLGLAAGETVCPRDRWRARVHEDDQERAEAAFRAAVDGLAAYEVEYRIWDRDGEVRWLALRAAIVPDGDGRPARAVGIATDVTSRKGADEVQARLAAIVEGSDDAIVGKTLEGIIVSWNKGAERIFGYTAAEMLGQPIARLVPPDRPDEIPAILAAIGRGEHVSHYETERMCKDGRRVVVSLTISPIRDAAGSITGVSKIARDVSERNAAEVERDRLLDIAQQARADAEAASRAKDELLSTVSHELRTPLAAMLGWVGVLRQGKLSAERASRALDTIERSGRLQAELIDDLLDVSRIVTGRLRLDARPVDLLGVARAAVDAIRPEAAAKGVRLEATFGAGATVIGDAMRLQQVLFNVLGNAVKFTPAGGEVELRTERTDGRIRIIVRDTGRGIAPDLLPHVFEPFRQADDVKIRKSSGLGLGLAIVRSLVEQHHGTVVARSDGVGTGATFTITLPLADPPGSAQKAPRGDEDDA